MFASMIRSWEGTKDRDALAVVAVAIAFPIRRTTAFGHGLDTIVTLRLVGTVQALGRVGEEEEWVKEEVVCPLGSF